MWDRVFSIEMGVKNTFHLFISTHTSCMCDGDPSTVWLQPFEYPLTSQVNEIIVK